MAIGIISAMREEAECLLPEMHDLEEVRAGMRTYYKGTLWALR
jgi:nucleoside phosphorylase